jgi:hypothetical protein
MNKLPKEKNQNKSLFDILISLSNNLTTAIRGINQQILLFIIAISLILVIFVITVQVLSPNIPALANLVLIIIGILALTAMIIVSLLLRQKGRAKKTKEFPQKTPENFSDIQEVTKLTLTHSPRRSNDKGALGMSNYDMLYKLLGRFPRLKFEKLINALLSVEELNFLPKPINIISKVEFLGYMKESGRLADIDVYLRENYPDLF